MAELNESGIYVGLQSIKNLTPNPNRLTIRARVNTKSIIHCTDDLETIWCYFNLADETGEIRATAFNEECNQFYNKIEVGKVYYISNPFVKLSENEFNPLNNKYEINFHSITQVQLCETETSIPWRPFQFVKINRIKAIPPGTLIDVIGICKEADDVTTIKGLKKKDIQIVDDSKSEVQVTLWETQSENFNGEVNSVIALKAAKVTDYRGRCLSIAASSIVMVDPEIEEARNLLTWYSNGGRDEPTENLTEPFGNDFAGRGRRAV